MIPPQLKDFRFVKLTDNTKNPYEQEWTTKNNYSYNELKDINGNYGVVCGNGLIVIDIDDGTKPELPKTFTVKTRKGYHFYYKVAKNIQTIRESFGDIQANGVQVVGPGSIVYDKPTTTTTQYTIVDPSDVAIVDLDTLLFILGKIYSITLNYNYNYDYNYHMKEDTKEESKEDTKEESKEDAKEEIVFNDFISNGNENYAFENGISIIRTNNKLKNKNPKIEYIRSSMGKSYPYAVVVDEEILRFADSSSGNTKEFVFSGEIKVLYVKSACNARMKAEKFVTNASNIIVMYKRDKHYSSYIITDDFFKQNKDTLLYGFTDEIIILITELQSNILSMDKSQMYKKDYKNQCETWITDIKNGTILTLTHNERRRLGLYLVRNSVNKETIKELLFDKLVQTNSIETFETQYRSWKKFVSI